MLFQEFPVTKNTLARTLKSVVQALALSQGPERAHRFVRDLVLVELVDQDLTSFCSPEHPMDTLQEALKESGSEPAEPRLIAEVGRNSILASYQVGIYLNKKMIGRGELHTEFVFFFSELCNPFSRNSFYLFIFFKQRLWRRY